MLKYFFEMNFFFERIQDTAMSLTEQMAHEIVKISQTRIVEQDFAICFDNKNGYTSEIMKMVKTTMGIGWEFEGVVFHDFEMAANVFLENIKRYGKPDPEPKKSYRSIYTFVRTGDSCGRDVLLHTFDFKDVTTCTLQFILRIMREPPIIVDI